MPSSGSSGVGTTVALEEGERVDSLSGEDNPMNTTPRPQRLYGIFWIGFEGKPLWALSRNGRNARREGKKLSALVVSMVLPAGGGGWDAPTFRALADRREGDWRPAECLTCGGTYPCIGSLRGTHSFKSA